MRESEAILTHVLLTTYMYRFSPMSLGLDPAIYDTHRMSNIRKIDHYLTTKRGVKASAFYHGQG